MAEEAGARDRSQTPGGGRRRLGVDGDPAAAVEALARALEREA